MIDNQGGGGAISFLIPLLPPPEHTKTLVVIFLFDQSEQMSRRVVSKRKILPNEKVGHVRPVQSLEVHVDTLQSTRIEETASTRTYVKPSAPVPVGIPIHPPPPPQNTVPSAPPMDIDRSVHRPERLRKHAYRPSASSCHFDYVGVALLIVAILATAWGWSILMTPTIAVLDHVSWTFAGEVSESRIVTEEGWYLPADATPLQSVERQRSTRSVLDYERPVCDMITVPVQIFSHYDTRCSQVVTGSTPELEVFIETNEVCYDDGQCEEQDVYQKLPTQPIYQEVCEQVPVYITTWHPKEECTVERVMRDEPVMGTYWTYSILRWVPSRSVHFDSTDVDDVKRTDPSALMTHEQYASSTWSYYLYFDSHAITVKVPQHIYDKYVDRIGQEVEVPG